MLWRLWRIGRQSLRRYIYKEPLQGLAFVSVILIVWLVITMITNQALGFLEQDRFVTFKPRLVESIIALFFFALYFLMVISDMVVSWTALFRSESAVFQGQLPLTNRALYWNAFTEGGLWSGWALLVLAVPLAFSLKNEAAQPYYFLPAAFFTFFCFFLCCMSTGGLCAIILGRLIPYIRRGMKGILLLMAIVIVIVGFMALGALENRGQPSTFMREIIGKLSFTENPYLPPFWAQQSLTNASLSRWMDWVYYLALMLSFSTMLSLIGEYIANRRLRVDIDRLTGRPENKRESRSKPWPEIPLFNKQTALLIMKDLRLFIRDPAQVMQFAMFFGLLSLYILMLPRISQTFAFTEAWRPVVSLLNLAAISMAMATFTGRFVYPMLSLEGKRLWVLMLAPWQPERIVSSKFIFACLVAIPISVMLVTSSGYLLELSNRTIIYEVYVTICLGLGLSASALGTGARLADYREDNPAKLVAGYGGTINLLASITFCAFILAGASLPIVNGNETGTWIIGILWTGIVSTMWICYGLFMAHHWFTRQVWQCSPDTFKETMEKRGTRYTSLFIIKVFATMLIMYIISYGPAVYLWNETGWPKQMLYNLYAPIVWAKNNTLFSGVIEWYVGLFN